MIEISTIFGIKKMKQAAMQHGTMFETTIPTIGQGGFAFDKIILWSTCRNDSKEPDNRLDADEEEAVSFLESCLHLNPESRITARGALQHSFLREDVYEDDPFVEEDEEEDELALVD